VRSWLAPLALRELHYRLLSGPYRATIAPMAIASSNTLKIGQVIRRIKTKIAEPIRVEDLASMAKTSLSSFHQHLKAVTAMSPVQYQKRLRLTEARHILLAGSADAASAVYRVGYPSVSRFSREYARMFGAPPMRDVSGLRGTVAMQISTRISMQFYWSEFFSNDNSRPPLTHSARSSRFSESRDRRTDSSKLMDSRFLSFRHNSGCLLARWASETMRR